MKILVIVNDLSCGGVTTSAINFCNYYAQKNHNVKILNLGFEGKYDTKALDRRVENIKLTGLGKFCNLTHKQASEQRGVSKLLLLLLGFVKKITTQFKLWYPIVFSFSKIPQQFDVVIAFRQCAPCCYFALNKCISKKKIIFIHGDINYMGNTSSWDTFLCRFDVIACVSNVVRQGVQKKYPVLAEKCRTIYNLFDIEQINKNANEYVPNFSSTGLFLISTIARQDNFHKGTHLIPEVCKILKAQEVTDIHWFVVGDGPDLLNNVELSKSYAVDDIITYVGEKSNPLPYIKFCDISVLTSRTEAYPMVIKECQILHKTIISTNYNGVEETVKNGISGYIVRNDPHAIADMIIAIKNNKSLLLSDTLIDIGKYNNELASIQFIESISSK